MGRNNAEKAVEGRGGERQISGKDSARRGELTKVNSRKLCVFEGAGRSIKVR